jgi:acetyl esterase/lipase
MRLSVIITSVFLLSVKGLFAQTDSIYLWANSVPGESKPKLVPVITIIEDGTPRVTEVTNPFFAVFPPKAGKKNSKAIIVCPGGAFVRLAAIKEGYNVANWLTELGYTVFVLHYRVPDKRDGASQDIERAFRYIRYNAKKYGIDPSKIAGMGFSAGAHLVARAGMADALINYPVQDVADTLSARPDYMIIIYPGYLSGGPNRSLTPEQKATEKTVPTFIFQTMDDNSAPSALALGTALRDAKANVELHMLPKGGHGYGMTPGNKAAEAWPGLLAAWLKENF